MAKCNNQRELHNVKQNSPCIHGVKLCPIARQRGVSLLEVLIAVLVLSVGLLGIAGLQTANLRNSQSAQQRTIAVVLATSMAERIRSNVVIARAGGFALEKQCEKLDQAGNIQSVELANWLDELRLNLGRSDKSCGEVVYTAASQQYVVNVYWDDSRALGGSAEMAISYQVDL